MEDSQVDQIFAGDLENLPPFKQPLIRIYMSSTFTDMALEKAALFSEVYPKLKEYCREHYGLEFQIIDMRWGVRDEATDDHSTTKICLEEIKNCQDMSVGPNFIFLGGQKYGFRPIPPVIPLEEYQIMRESIQNLGKNAANFIEWYAIDENSEPPVMVLQPISSKLPNFLNALIPEEQEADQRKWYEVLTNLQETLRYVSTYLFKTEKFTYEQMQNYQVSVIEREVNQGIVAQDFTKMTSLAFLRRIDQMNMSDTRGGEGRQPRCFVDLEGKSTTKADEEAMALAEKLRDEIVPDHLEKKNFKQYVVEWFAMNGTDTAAYDKYLRTFLQDFYVAVIKLIDKSMRNVDTSVRGLMAAEIHKHMHICNESAKKFLGREFQLYKVKSYILSSLTRPFLIYGQTGTGKSMFAAKIATDFKSWMDNPRKTLLVVRFLGTTPTSSSIPTMLLSICQQICYNMEIPIEEIPEDFVPLKNYFKILLDKTCEKFFLLILLDAIEIFFVNSHQNGATSWIPKDLPKNVKIILTFTKDHEEVSAEKSKFMQGFTSTSAFTKTDNILQLKDLGAVLAEKVLKFWMGNIHRTLTNYQWRVAMNAMHSCSLALFLDLCYGLMKTWKSYDPPEATVIPKSFYSGIIELFENVERKFGHTLVSHAVSYITASKSGLSETELEDILCLDENVLDEVFRFNLPEVRRIPPILWTKIRRDLKEHFTEHEADGSRVVVWAHKQFRDVGTQQYLKTESIKSYLHGIMSDYFMGTWANGRQKPFKYTELHRQRCKVTGRNGKSDRKMPAQPNVFKGTDGKVARYNMRKFGELPYHLIGSNRVADLCEQVLFNYHWLHSKISAMPITAILNDFMHALTIIDEPNLRRQVKLVLGAFQLSRTVLDKYPDMLSAHLIGRLLPEINNHWHIRNLILQCDNEGFEHNCLVPMKYYLNSPGGPLKYSLEGHRFAIFGSSLTHDKRYVVSISNRFISWDVNTSEVCRDIDPRADGMILGLAITVDDRYAAAFTTNNQLIIIDIMLGHYLKVEHPMEKMDEIVNIAVTDKSAIVYNTKYWRSFNFDGQHMKSEKFAIQLSDVLSMIFLSENLYLSLHWTGDQEFEDTRIWMQTSVDGEKSEQVMVYNSFELGTFTENVLTYFACQKVDSVLSTYQLGETPSKWCLIRYERDPRGNSKEKANVLSADIEDVFGLKLHQTEKVTCLACAIPDAFQLFFNPMMGDHKNLDRSVKRLNLPRSVVNIRTRLNESNPGILVEDPKLFIAGVRKDIFVWDWEKERMLRSFNAHNARILAMRSLLTPTQRIFISSSADRTVKVWEIDNLLETVHPIDQCDLKIEKLVICQKANTLISLTRGGLSFWNLETGNCDCKDLDSAGGYVTDVALPANGKYFVSAENDQKVIIWNLNSRVVIHKDIQINVAQLLIIEDFTPHLILAVSKIKCKKTGADLYHVVGRNDNGKRVYKFDCQVTREFPMIVTKDLQYLAILAVVPGKIKECVSVYHSRKGVFLFRVILKYPHMKRPVKFLSYSDSSCLIIDSEKANVIDLRNKSFERSIKHWTGQSWGDDIGLATPNGGGLHYIDIKAGKIVRSLLGSDNEGVFKIHAEFTKCGRYILYYHNAKRTVRLFKRDGENKQVANYCLHTEATAFITSEDGNRLIVGGLDGTVSFFVVAHNSPHELEDTRIALKKLPSRKWQKRHRQTEEEEDKTQSMSTQSAEAELERRRMRKKEVLRRFRAIVRVTMMMEKLCNNYKKSKKTQKKMSFAGNKKDKDGGGCTLS